MSVAHEVADWLRGLPHIEMAQPVKVTIGKHEFLGALYVQTATAQATERVVTEGPMEAGEILRTTRLYLLGKRPKLVRKNVVFVADQPVVQVERCYHPGNEWYVAGYYEGEITEHQPWGANLLVIHHLSMNFGYYDGWKIDTGDQHAPYLRQPMTIEELD